MKTTRRRKRFARNVFQSAQLRLPSGRKLGLLRVANFGPVPYMILCARAAGELTNNNVKLTPQNVRQAIQDDWFANFADLAESLQRLKSDGADALLVDISNNCRS